MHLPLTADKHNPLGLALVAAISLHAFLIFGIGFEFEPPSKIRNQRSSLEITVIRQPPKPSAAQESPSFAAQANQQGGGNQKEKIRPTLKTTSEPIRNLIATKNTPSLSKQSPVEQQKTPKLINQKATREKTVTEKVIEVRRQTAKKALHDEAQAEPKRRVSAAQIFATRSAEIDRMTTQVINQSNAYAKRNRHKAISASTTEYKYASYLDAWRRKVEKFGNLNYPKQARDDKLYGSLILHVSLKTDGSIENIRVVHSSGHKILDQAAKRIVRLAAPFAPFPEAIRKETDILDITRTWQFLSSNQLGWGK